MDRGDVLDPANLSGRAQSSKSPVFKKLGLEDDYGRKYRNREERLRINPGPFLGLGPSKRVPFSTQILTPTHLKVGSFRQPAELSQAFLAQQNCPKYLWPPLEGTARISGWGPGHSAPGTPGGGAAGSLSPRSGSLCHPTGWHWTLCEEGVRGVFSPHMPHPSSLPASPHPHTHTHTHKCLASAGRDLPG